MKKKLDLIPTKLALMGMALSLSKIAEGINSIVIELQKLQPESMVAELPHSKGEKPDVVMIKRHASKQA